MKIEFIIQNVDISLLEKYLYFYKKYIKLYLKLFNFSSYFLVLLNEIFFPLNTFFKIKNINFSYKRKISVVRSPHIFKKSKEHFFIHNKWVFLQITFKFFSHFSLFFFLFKEFVFFFLNWFFKNNFFKIKFFFYTIYLI